MSNSTDISTIKAEYRDDAERYKAEMREELSRILRKEFASRGGKARQAKMTKEERIEIGKKGAKVRWGKKEQKGKE